MSDLLLINGPNLNLLGSREPKHYGQKTLPQIEMDLVAEAERLGHRLATYQSNHEGELVDRVHKAKADNVAFILLNPGGYTHTSVALRDAVLASQLPVVEVHVTNPQARESFRHASLISGAALGVVHGFGADSYLLGLRALAGRLGRG